MISAGNDIVALTHVDARRTRQARFYSKILSDAEFGLYNKGRFPDLPFENFIWLLWSIKESVYKYQKRYNQDIAFSPKKIIIRNIVPPENNTFTKFGSGQVEGNSAGGDFFYTSAVCFCHETLFARSRIHNEVIYSFVNAEDNFEHIRWGIKFVNCSDYENQSKAVRSFTINRLSAFFPDCNLQVVKSAAGVPLLFTESEETGIPLSFSHHGNFIAYCFLIRD